MMLKVFMAGVTSASMLSAPQGERRLLRSFSEVFAEVSDFLGLLHFFCLSE